MFELKNFKIIDLSSEIRPGILKVNGEYLHGNQNRRFELKQFIYAPDKMLMNWVETESHIGTHVELPAHFIQKGKSSSEMPIQIFLGEAIVFDFTDLKPKEGKGQPILPSHFSKVKKDDIILLWSSLNSDEQPYISAEASEYLAKKPVRMVGVQNIRVEAPNGATATHMNLLKNEIPLIEGLVNLERISKERVFYVGLPLKVSGLDSSWIRAIALEPCG